MKRWISVAVVVGLVAATFAFCAGSRHLMDIFILVCLMGTMATAWNLMGGYAGLTSLGHSLFIGLGAYSVAYLQIRFELPFFVTWPIGVLLGLLAALLIGFLSFRYRLRGHHFAIATLAFSEIAFFLVSAAEWLGRADGLVMPSLEPGWMYLQFAGKWQSGLIIAAILCMTLIGANLLLLSRPGYYWRAIRDNEDAADALGVPITRYKMAALACSAAIAALCGAFYASYVSFVDPRSMFGVELSIQLLVFSIIGGLRKLWGPLLGAALLVPAGEILRDAVGASFQGASIAMYALLLVLLALVLPQGLGGLITGRRAPRTAPSGDKP